MDDECADCGAKLDSGSAYVTIDWTTLEDGSIAVLVPPVGRWVCGACWEQLPGTRRPFATLVYEEPRP